MKRRTLLGTGLGAMVVAGAPARAQSAVTLTLITDRADKALALADRVARTSEGALQINVEAPTGTGAGTFLASVSAGDADMYLSAEEAFVDANAAFGIFSSMPGGMSPSELESWIKVADGRFMWDILGEEYGVKCFMAGDDGPMPIWSKSPLTSAADLTGGKVGSVGLGGNIMRAMGVGDVSDIRAGGVDLASLDAFDGLNVAQMAEAGLLDTFPHMTSPNAGRPSSALSVGFNIGVWNTLSNNDKILIERCIMAEHSINRMKAMHDSASALQAASASVTSNIMPQDIWTAQLAAANGTMLEIIESGNLGADIGDAYLYFISDVAGWSEIGETAFFLGRKGALTQ
ncbi:MAG: hypothetical protein AAFQ09_07470 [Pseudomonadota bacterium]